VLDAVLEANARTTCVVLRDSQGGGHMF
jgi:hypothetical protein